MTRQAERQKRLDYKLKDREKALKCITANAFIVECINGGILYRLKSNQRKPETLVQHAAVLHSSTALSPSSLLLIHLMSLPAFHFHHSFVRPFVN